MPNANSHNCGRLIRRICISLAMILVTAAGLGAFHGARTAFQHAEDVTSQFMDEVAQELTWQLSHGEV